MAGPSLSKMAYQPMSRTAGQTRVAKHEYSSNTQSGSGALQKKRHSKSERARVLPCKTWSLCVLDEKVDDGKPPCESAGHMQDAASEAKHGHKSLTSFLPESEQEKPGTMTSRSVLSSHVDVTNNSPALDHTNLGATLDITTTPGNTDIEQHHKNTMTPVKPKARRVKYKEQPPTVLASLTTPSAAEPEEQLHSSQHVPAESTPPTTTHSAHSDEKHTATSPACTTERITNSPLEVTTEALEAGKALVPYSSSSAASEHSPHPSSDSAIKMPGKKTRYPPQSKQLVTHVDQELVFRGRRSVEPSNATNDSWRWDQALGTLVSNTSGASFRPALASKTSNQRVTCVTIEPGASTFADSNKLEDSTWAKEPVARITNEQNDWATSGNGDWDTGHPPYPSQNHNNATFNQNNKDQARSQSRPINLNGRSRIEPKRRKPKESPWIKDSLIPKGDPKRHKIRWSSPSRQSSSFDSDRASSGWGTRRKRGQNVHGADLADWAGGLGPASIDWDSRSQFRDHQSTAKIEKWLGQACIALEHAEQVRLTNGGNTFTLALSPSGNRELVEQEQGDVAPRYWLLNEIDGKSANVFWAEHVQTNGSDVKPVDKDDLKDAKPWWKDYVDGSHSMLKTLTYPEVAGIDPDENQMEKLARENDNGGANAVENRKAAEKAKRDAQRKRTLAKRERAHKFSGTHNLNQSPTLSDTIKPGLHIFLRSATKEDMTHLRDIYNRYIDNTFVVPETERLTEADMLERWQAIKATKLPFIVACQRGEKIKARNKKGNGGEDMLLPDKVVGFACASEWSDGKCIYRPTVKLEVFVHMEQYMKHIGSCLADKMMGLLDPRFVERGGYEVVEELDAVEPSRTISNVLVNYSHDANKKDKLLWVSKWLKTRFGFEKVADLQGVAQKFDNKYAACSIEREIPEYLLTCNRLNLAILQKTIGATAPAALANANHEG